MLYFVKQFDKETVLLNMKKAIPISLIFIVMTAMLHLSVATHYCSGKIASSKISFSGKLASCGMEDIEKDLPLTGAHFASHCCDNVLVFYGINSIYFPSFSFVPESCHHNSQVYILHICLTYNSLALNKSLCTNESPPDPPVSNNVDLSDICIFRI